jgi:hypothetical protein
VSFAEEQIQTVNLSFLHELATDPQRTLSAEEQSARQLALAHLRQADTVVIALGGKAGRLGESVVGTALLEGSLQLLRMLGKEGIPVYILLASSVVELFPQQAYRKAYWPTIHILHHDEPLALPTLPPIITGQHICILDLHGAHDGMPQLQTTHARASSAAAAVVGAETSSAPTTAAAAEPVWTIIGPLFRVGVRDYAKRGVERRYADFLCDLFGLPPQLLDGMQVQPRLFGMTEDTLRFEQFAREHRLSTEAVLIVCSFQSVVLAKCYELWDEVIEQISAFCAHKWPERKLEFVVACGPDKDQPDGFKQSDMVEWLTGITGTYNNTRVIVARTATLRDLVALYQHATLALCNDTGPCHIAGALHIPTIVPYLPGNLYSQLVWSSTPWHHGVTLEPDPYTYQQLINAVTWGHTDIIDRIAPQALAQEAIKVLQAL